MQDGVGLGQVKNISLHDSHSVIPVDSTDLIIIRQSKLKFYWTFNYNEWVSKCYHKINEKNDILKNEKLKTKVTKMIETLI